MKQSLNDWQRLEKVVAWTGLSVPAFAKEIGVKSVQNLYQIKSDENKISRALAKEINNRYPEISSGWLLTQDGSMFLCQQAGVPYYGVEATTIADDITKYEPVGRIVIPGCEECTFAANSNTDAMNKSIPQGSIVLLKEVSVENVVSGYNYLVCCRNISTIRNVKNLLQEGKLILTDENKNNNDGMVIDVTLVKKIYFVQSVIKIQII